MAQTFFEKPLQQSKIKSQIVAKYFPTWAKIIQKYAKDKIAYIDLFAGPGIYKDGTESTPILILKKAISIPNIKNSLVSIFTDEDAGNIETLKKEVAKIPRIETLRNPPQIKQEKIGQKIVETLQNMRLIPSLVFLDPCGYKGLSLGLINSVIKDWACECIFFFNYNRINAGIYNDRVEEHINLLFGKKRAIYLRRILIGKSTHQREQLILEQLLEALKETHGNFVQHFCVKHRSQDRTSHYLIFVTKNFLGYEIMRDIMGNCSSDFTQGVPSFEYNYNHTGNLFYKPLDNLKQELLIHFAGKTIKVGNMYKTHSPGRNYIKKNYKDALKQLAKEGKIKTIPLTGKIPKGTMGDNISVQFSKDS